MASIVGYYNQIDAVISDYVYAFGDMLNADLRPTVDVTKNWPLVDSPTPCVLLLLKYLIVVSVCYGYQKLFPSKEKKPDGPILKAFIMFHNLFLAVLSAWMGSSMIYYTVTTGYKIWGEAYEPARDVGIAWVSYIFYLSKYYEFIDTYIMLIKGNLNQVSFLHVYHHFSTVIIFFLVSKLAPGGDSHFCITLNCWVHVVMYSYYFLTTVIKTPESRKKYLWWGKYLTQMQLTQFFLNLVQAFWCFFYSPYWYPGKVLQSVDMTVLLILFGDFYIKKYKSDSAAKAVKQKTN